MRRIRGFACDHCPKRYTGHNAAYRMVSHELHCFRNPGRKPREGEVYGTDHSTWYDDGEQQPWEPSFLGAIYVEGTWHIVPGHIPKSALLACEVWPYVEEEGRGTVLLNEASRTTRLAWFNADCPVHPLESDAVPF